MEPNKKKMSVNLPLVNETSTSTAGYHKTVTGYTQTVCLYRLFTLYQGIEAQFYMNYTDFAILGLN